jgi:hypothetical protein
MIVLYRLAAGPEASPCSDAALNESNDTTSIAHGPDKVGYGYRSCWNNPHRIVLSAVFPVDSRKEVCVCRLRKERYDQPAVSNVTNRPPAATSVAPARPFKGDQTVETSSREATAGLHKLQLLERTESDETPNPRLIHVNKETKSPRLPPLDLWRVNCIYRAVLLSLVS